MNTSSTRTTVETPTNSDLLSLAYRPHVATTTAIGDAWMAAAIVCDCNTSTLLFCEVLLKLAIYPEGVDSLIWSRSKATQVALYCIT
jgi:hypothetical protein